MNLKLAVALSSTASGCQIGFLDSDEAAQVNYSRVMIQYGIRARAGDLVAVDLGTPRFRLVYVWSLVEVSQVETNTAYYLDLSGAEQSLAIPEAYKGKIISGMSIFTDRQVLADWAEKGRPVHPARIAQIIFPRIEAMYKPFDSPYLGMIDRFTQGQRDDVTPLFADYSAFAQLVKDLADHFEDTEIDYVVGIDALGLGVSQRCQLRKSVESDGMKVSQGNVRSKVSTKESHSVETNAYQSLSCALR